MSGRTEWGEGRRLRAWELKQQGWTQRSIARALGVTEGAVSQWCKRAREHGAAALRRRIVPGPSPKLPPEQLAELPAFLALGAEAFGFRGAVWTTPRVAAVIERVFGVRYHPAHVSRLLRAIGWSPQKPIRRATQRAETAIERWLTERWPALRREAERDGRTVVWVDESGFYLLPAAVRTYAPVGRTPVLRVPLTRDHLSAISAITRDGRLFLAVQPQAIRAPDVVRFLKHLLRHLPGRLLVLWDGSPIHRARPVKDFLAAGGAARLRLEQLPAYAPELNPDEGIWHLLKHVELRNRCCPTLWHLRGDLRNAVTRLRRKPRIVQACIRHAGLYLERPVPRAIDGLGDEVIPEPAVLTRAVRRGRLPGRWTGLVRRRSRPAWPTASRANPRR